MALVMRHALGSGTLASSGKRLFVVNHDGWVRIRRRNWQPPVSEEFAMLFDAPLGLVETILDGMTDTGESW